MSKSVFCFSFLFFSFHSSLHFRKEFWGAVEYYIYYNLSNNDKDLLHKQECSESFSPTVYILPITCSTFLPRQIFTPNRNQSFQVQGNLPKVQGTIFHPPGVLNSKLGVCVRLNKSSDLFVCFKCLSLSLHKLLPGGKSIV